MRKHFKVLLLLVVFARSLKLNNQLTTKRLKAFDTNINHQTKESEEAYKRFLEFLSSNRIQNKLIKSKQELNEMQMMKIVRFMVNDPYFQTQLINAVEQDNGNEWLKQLPKQAKIRFIQIITEVQPSQYGFADTMIQVIQQLKSDRQIGKVLMKNFGDDLNAQVVSNNVALVHPIAKRHIANLTFT